MRILADTNVLISAVATRGLCADVLREILVSHELIICDQILVEVRTVMRTKLVADQELTSEFVRFLEQNGILAQPAGFPDVELRDKADRLVLSAAIAGGASVLVTGDKELLELDKVQNVTILSPRQFWERFGPVHRIVAASGGAT